VPITKVELVITTTSQVMQFNNLPAAQPPKITMNGNPVGQIPQKPSNPTGWQILVLDPSKDITTPAAVLANRYISLYPASGSNFWMSTYQFMYTQMLRQSLLAGNYEQQILIVASYGLDANTPPTNDGLHLLLDYGAGPRLQYWETHVDVGSQVANGTSWTSFPANYVFVGSSALAYGQGAEVFDRATTNNSVQSTLTTTLTNFGAES
jgi:hypothetical protein